MKSYFRCLTGSVVIISSLFFSACSMMPKEEEFPSAPVLKSYQAKEYRETLVLRGNLAIEENISCRYVPAKVEELSFRLGGEYITNVYVGIGDQVKAGTVLAELECTNLNAEAEELEYSIRSLELEKTHAEELRELELERCNALYRSDRELLEDKLAETRDNYTRMLQPIEDSLYVQRLRLDEVKNEIADRKIIAGIDGTVTFAESVSDGQRSTEGKRMFTISDVSTTSFVVSGSDASLFPVGTEVLIKCKDSEYFAQSVEPSVLDLDPSQTSESTEEKVYLQLAQPDPNLKNGDTGLITVVLDSREDILYVKEDAVRVSDGNYFVYMLNESGLRYMQNVTIGFRANGFVEIISGLNEGDSVVVD